MNDFSQLVRFQRQLIEQLEGFNRISLGPMSQMVESILRREEIWQNQTRELAKITEWKNTMPDMLLGLETSKKLLESVLLESNQWSELIANISPNLPIFDLQAASLSATIWQESLSEMAESMGRISLIDSLPKISTHLLIPHQMYSSFSRSIISEIENNTDGRIAERLSGALYLAEEQIVSSTEIMSGFLAEFDSADNADIATEEPLVNIFENQKSQLLQSGEISQAETVGDLILFSYSARNNSRARKVTQCLVRCNHTARVSGKREIFKPTTKLLDAFNKLPWISATNEDEMGKFVDALYFTLYESGGSDELRFLEYMENSECEIIWIIKHLRNKFFRHDPDHGSKSEQEKSWQQLSKCISALGLKKFPATSDEFQLMQESLLKKTELFLDQLLSRIPNIDAN